MLESKQLHLVREAHPTVRLIKIFQEQLQTHSRGPNISHITKQLQGEGAVSESTKVAYAPCLTQPSANAGCAHVNENTEHVSSSLSPKIQ